MFRSFKCLFLCNYYRQTTISFHFQSFTWHGWIQRALFPLTYYFFPIFWENNIYLATFNLFTNTSLSHRLHLTLPSTLPLTGLKFLDLPILPCREKPPRRNVRQGKLSALSKSQIKFLIRRFYLELCVFCLLINSKNACFPTLAT